MRSLRKPAREPSWRLGPVFWGSLFVVGLGSIGTGGNEVRGESPYTHGPCPSTAKQALAAEDVAPSTVAERGASREVTEVAIAKLASPQVAGPLHSGEDCPARGNQEVADVQQLAVPCRDAKGSLERADCRVTVVEVALRSEPFAATEALGLKRSVSLTADSGVRHCFAPIIDIKEGAQ